MSRPNVPEFGKWDKEENVPYTMYFDNARKTRGGKIINPNDPQEYPETKPNASPNPRTKHEGSVGRGEQGGNGDLWHSPGHKASNDSSYGRHGSQPVRPSYERSPLHPQQGRSPRLGVAPESPVHHMQARSPKLNIGSNQGFEKSPLHPQQSKHVPRGSGSPVIEGRGRDSSHGSNGRPRMTQSKNDQATTVPRFGQWNGKDQSAENFTDIFEKVREEKNSLGGTTPKNPSSSVRSQGSSKPNEPKKLCGCFPW